MKNWEIMAVQEGRRDAAESGTHPALRSRNKRTRGGGRFKKQPLPHPRGRALIPNRGKPGAHPAGAWRSLSGPPLRSLSLNPDSRGDWLRLGPAAVRDPRSDWPRPQRRASRGQGRFAPISVGQLRRPARGLCFPRSETCARLLVRGPRQHGA